MTSQRDQETSGVRRAWGWVSHLRDGGTTPWRGWAGEGETRGRILPGAQQLELLRRLNAAGTVSPVLAGRVLAASAPGRGRPDLELLGAVETLAFGPPPVDPGHLADDELVRVATGLIAEDVVATGLPEQARARVRPWRTRYRIVGDPVLADPIRAELTARGRPPGGRGSVVLVVGTDLGRMIVDAWASRCLDDGAPPWRDWLTSSVHRHQAPPRVDLLQTASTWAGRVGPERVRIVLDPAAVPRLVGVRRLVARPDDVSADGLELARRVGAVLGLLVVHDRRRALLRHTFRPRLAAVPGPRLAVPSEHAEWVHRRAVRMRDALRHAGYAVVGDLDALLPLPGDPGAAVDISDAGTLALAIRLLLDGDGDGKEGT